MSTEEGRTEYAKACALILRGVKEPVELENHVKRLSLETGFPRDVLMQQIGITPPQSVKAAAPRRESFSKKAKEAASVDWNARTLLAALATGRLPKDIVSPEEFQDSQLRSLYEALAEGANAAQLMESQTDEAGRAVVADILSIQTDVDDASLMKMAHDCLIKMRRERLENELDQIQKSLSRLDEASRTLEAQRAVALTKQLLELKE